MRLGLAKFHTNILRDRRVSAALRHRGYHIARFWETDILRSPNAVLERIAELLVCTKR